MLYNLQIEQKKQPTDTNISGTRLLLTLGVEISGKKLDNKIFTPFLSIKESIDLKKQMRSAPKGNMPITVKQKSDSIKEKWSVRELKKQMNSMLFHRLALSKDKKGVLALAKKGIEISKPEDVIKDSYVFEFLI
ncbi:MAG: hypothetical protein LBT18_03140 [Endomicrobium sp.]|jgi:hypothetical protein|nr:hypothetical protein [Endomicrobium sp.]